LINTLELDHNKSIRLALIGARIDGQAGVVLDVLSHFENIKVVAFFDNTPALQGTMVQGIPVIGNIEDATQEDLSNIDFFHISMGDNSARFELYRKLKKRGHNLLTIIHPMALVSKTAQIAEGCFIGAYAVIQNNSFISNFTITISIY